MSPARRRTSRRRASRRHGAGRAAYRRRGCLGRLVRAGLLLALLALLAAGALGWWARRQLGTPYQGYAGEETIVTIEPGSDASEILDTLAERGVIADPLLARLWLVYGLDDPPLAAGEYRFAGPATVHQVLERLVEGDVVTHPVTLVEGLTLPETAAALAAAGFGDEQRFLAAMRDPAPIADLDPEATDLEGYLFPDTYAFAHGTGEGEIVATLVTTFRRRWSESVEPLLADEGTAESGDDADAPRAESSAAEPADAGSASGPTSTLRGVVTLASIVEKEARLDDERPVIAGVYANRLERGIALYADPTVIFALKLAGTWDGNLRRPDLQLDSPYNTYRYPGLPPGPIASPGLASLRAAAAPADVEYLYFVSRNDGSHVFSRTLAEHNRQVNEWQRRYWRRRAAGGAGEGSGKGTGDGAGETAGEAAAKGPAESDGR